VLLHHLPGSVKCEAITTTLSFYSYRICLNFYIVQPIGEIKQQMQSHMQNCSLVHVDPPKFVLLHVLHMAGGASAAASHDQQLAAVGSMACMLS
jgi:hypothetical protein